MPVFLFETNDVLDRNDDYGRQIPPILERELKTKLHLKNCKIERPEIDWTDVDDNNRLYDGFFTTNITKNGNSITTLDTRVELMVQGRKPTLTGIRLVVSKRDMKKLKRNC